MGLDVSAYSKIEFVRPCGDGDYSDGQCSLKANKNFPGRFTIADGIYSFANRMHFRAGPYSYYNSFREWIASIVGKVPREVWGLRGIDDTMFSFRELIDFSDCEGCISSETCAKLHRDFVEHRAASKTTPTNVFNDHYEQFHELYDEFLAAFEMGADGGAVKFS